MTTETSPIGSGNETLAELATDLSVALDYRPTARERRAAARHDAMISARRAAWEADARIHHPELFDAAGNYDVFAQFEN